ncbi:MAG: glycosyltransferase [Phycicoccus sp.]
MRSEAGLPRPPDSRMTLAPARPPGTSTDPAEEVAPTVTAVVVTRTDPRGLSELLDLVLGQSLAPDAVLVLDRTGGTRGPDDTDVAAVLWAARARSPVPVREATVDPRVPLRTVAWHAVREQIGDPTLVWFLPVGTEPEPAVLAGLVDAWRRSPSTGVVGGKHVDADDPHLLRAVALRSTRGGRLLTGPVPGEPDQGQYDQVSDVLAVPFAGSLVERDLLLALRGWGGSFGDVAADLDLGWRAHAAGRRVVVVPHVRLRSVAGTAVATARTPARRRAARRVALARVSWWAAPALAVWVTVTSVVAGIGLLLLKRPRAAWAELSGLAALDPVGAVAARWGTRQVRTVSRRDLRTVFEPRRAVLASWADAVHDALVPPRPPIGEQAHDLSPRSWLAHVIRHPGMLATAAVAAVTVLGARTLGLDVLTGAGAGLTGGELAGTRADATALWHSWSDGWTGGGLGAPGSAGSQALLLAGPSWLVEHVPLLPDPASPAGLVVALLLLLGMPLATVSAYLALRVAARSGRVRALGAVAWSTTGAAVAAVAEGRLGAVVALVLLPAVGAGLWLVAARRSTATSAFATALALVVLGAFAPVLLPLAVVLAVVLVVLARRARVHALVVAVVPWLVLAPWVAPTARRSWSELIAGSGLADRGGEAVDPWRVVALDIGSAGATTWAGGLLVVGAVLALLRRRPGDRAPWALAVLLPVLLGVALSAPAIRLGTAPAGRGEAITVWTGVLVLPAALVSVLAVVRGLDGLSAERATRRGRVTARAVAVVAAVAVMGAAGAAAGTGLGTTLLPAGDPRPAVAVEQASGAFATRSLFVEPGPDGAGYRFVGREAAAVVRPLPVVGDADAAAAEPLTAVLGGSSDGTALFAATATDLLAIRAGTVPDVARRLDGTAGLTRIASRDGWDLWRVSPVGSRGDTLLAAPRLRIESPELTTLVPTSGAHGATQTAIDAPPDSRLVVAQPPAWAAIAEVSVDGRVLDADTSTGSPTYRLPTGRGELTVVLDDGRGWRYLQLGALLVLGFLAVPFGRRESRVAGR